MEARFRANDRSMPVVLRGRVRRGKAGALGGARGGGCGRGRAVHGSYTRGCDPWFGAPSLAVTIRRCSRNARRMCRLLAWGVRFSSQRAAFQNTCCVCAASLGRLLQQPLEIADETSAVLAGEGIRTLGAPARAADLLLLMANEELHVDGRLVVNASAHTDGGGIAAQNHAGEPDVLRDNDIAGLQALNDGEVGAVGAHANGERFHPESLAGIFGRAGIVAADMPLEVLRRVASDDDGHMAAPGNRQSIARDRASIRINGSNQEFLNSILKDAILIYAS